MQLRADAARKPIAPARSDFTIFVSDIKSYFLRTSSLARMRKNALLLPYYGLFIASLKAGAIAAYASPGDDP